MRPVPLAFLRLPSSSTRQCLGRALLRPRWIFVAAMLLGLGAVACWLLSDHLRARHHWQQAERYIDAWDFGRARAHLESFIALRPSDPQGHFALARLCRRSWPEDFSTARQQLDEARRLGWSAQETALEGILLSFQEQGREEDEVVLEPYTETTAPEEPLVLEALARGWIRLNQLNQTRFWLDRWVRDHPEDGYARLWRGAYFEYMNNPNSAISDFLWVEEHGHTLDTLDLHLGLMLAGSGYDFQNALAHMERYQQRHPDNRVCQVGIAECYRSLGRLPEAEGLLEPMVGADPHDFNALLTLALVEVDRARDDQALPYLRRLEKLALRSTFQENVDRLLRLEPIANNGDVPDRLKVVCHLLAGVLRRKGQKAEAEAYERRVVQLKKDGDALSAAFRERKQKPNDLAIMTRIGALYLRLEMGTEGVAMLERALRREDSREAHEALAAYYSRRDDPESQRLAQEHRRLAGSHP